MTNKAEDKGYFINKNTGKASPSKAPNYMKLLEEKFLPHVELFNSDNKGYAHIQEPNNNTVVSVGSDDFKLNIQKFFFENGIKTMNKAKVDEVITTIEGISRFSKPEKTLYNRTAIVGDNIYISLQDKTGRVIHVTKNGFKVVTCPDDIKFRTTASMLPLPEPDSMGDLSLIKDVISYGSEDNLLLIMAWMTDAMIAEKPFAVLIVEGQQGSGKSLCTEYITRSLDPSKPILKSLPKNEEDLIISIKNRWLK